MHRFEVDPAMFERAGFDTLYNAWNTVFNPVDGEHLHPADALQTTSDARSVVLETGIEPEVVAYLERTACHYAQVIPIIEAEGGMQYV